MPQPKSPHHPLARKKDNSPNAQHCYYNQLNSHQVFIFGHHCIIIGHFVNHVFRPVFHNILQNIVI